MLFVKPFCSYVLNLKCFRLCLEIQVYPFLPLLFFMKDGDLDVKISERRKGGKLFDESRIITWFMQLLLAVQYMHER